MSAVIYHLDRAYAPPQPYREPTMAELTAYAGEPAVRAGADHVDVTHWRGYRLPLRVEWNVAEPMVFYELVDADHRRVDVPGDFDQVRQLMMDVNATASRRLRTGEVLRGESLAYIDRLSELHPCNRHRVRLGLAFECMIVGQHTGWITNTDLWQLKNGAGVLEEDMTPKRKYAFRWHDWRLAENALLEERTKI